ncbi:hypothetical protein B7R22_09895 [Subtercola boreus]|uniref:Uncharacterized protein n=1 Tax=Subtercola boreus TaxID=120213 RepID=A0A3E0VW55_9MICO|nr:hypothetical protein [Subtercola boreus]RFA13940.1 hypothetical protein B7R22_09895 [Subtercola boreus]
MRHDPPSGEELDELIARMTGNVLAAAEPRTPAPSLQPVLPAASAVPKRRFRWGAVVVAALVVLGVGTAGGALALGFGPNLFPGATPTASPTPTEAPPRPTGTATIPPATTAPSTPPAPAGPSVATSTTTFTAPSWGSGLTAGLFGLAPDTDYEVRTDARYRGESKTPDGYFSVLSSPVRVTTDDSGRASVTWTPDVFPENFTDSGESGFMLGTFVRVDPVGGPADESSESGRADPVVLSAPLSIAYLPSDQVTISALACVEPADLVSGTGAGLLVTVSGLIPGEFGTAHSEQTGGPTSFTFRGDGRADETGTLHITVRGNTAEYPVSPSTAIAPGEWRLVFAGNFRETPTPPADYPRVPLQVGNCS